VDEKHLQEKDLKTTYRQRFLKNVLKLQGNGAFVVLLLSLLFLCAVVFKDFLLLRKIYFFNGVGSDSMNLYFPYLHHLADYIHRYGLPKWSFNMGMGQNLMPFCLRDPFDLILFAADKDNLICSMVYKEIIKIVVSGIVFFFYLRTTRLSEYTSIMGSLFFSFCGFMIVGSCWSIFSFEAFNMALLLLAFELLFMKRNWYLFPIPVFLLGVSQPFNLYVYGLLLAFYAVFRMLQTNTFTLKNAGSLFLKMAGLSVVGLLLSAPFLLENINQLLHSPRGSGENSYAHVLSSTPVFSLSNVLELGAGILRSFSSDMMGDAQHFGSWHNYLEAPLFYCGLPCLLFMSQVFQFQDRRRKLLFATFIILWLLPFFFPYLRYAFWLFTGNYYRAYSFFVAFLLIYYSMNALEQIILQRKVNLVILGITVAVLFALMYLPYKVPDPVFHIMAVNKPIRTFLSVLMPVYCLLICFMAFGNGRALPKYLFLIAVIIELTYLSGISVNNMEAGARKDWQGKGGYNDYTVEAIHYLKQADSSFYRTDKNYYSAPTYFFSYNDGMAQDYYGTSSYNPFNQGYYIHYLQLMGIADRTDESESRWAIGLRNRPVLEAENRIKYFLSKGDLSPAAHNFYDSVTTLGDVRIYRNRHVLPIGYTYRYYVKESAFSNLSDELKDIVSLKAVVLKDDDIQSASLPREFSLPDTASLKTWNEDSCVSTLNELSKDTLATTQFDVARIAGTISVSENRVMYITVPYDDGWQLYMDGAHCNKIIADGGMTGILLKKGVHHIAMVYELRLFRTGSFISLLGLLAYMSLWLYDRKKRSNQAVH